MMYALLFLVASFNSTALMATWFYGSDAVTTAHQYLLEGDTAESFLSIVEAWQQSSKSNEKRHLTKLLSLAINEDCGRSLSKEPLPSWLKKLVIRRKSVQTSNQVYYDFLIYGQAELGISALSLTPWAKKKINLTNENIKDNNDFKYGIKGLSQNVGSGLYKLMLTSKKGEVWSLWLLMSQADLIQKIRWYDSKSWKITPTINYKSNCPKPTLSMNIYQQNVLDDTIIWSLEKDNPLPTSLPTIDIEPGQYWFTVALIQDRWQGPVLFEDIQSIGRIVELPYLDNDL